MMPELAVSGYPPEDLLFHSGLRTQVARSIERRNRCVGHLPFSDQNANVHCHPNNRGDKLETTSTPSNGLGRLILLPRLKI